MTACRCDVDGLARMVAEHVVELLGQPRAAEALLDADEVARRLGVERDWVYRNASELGARRLGTGERARLRFVWTDVLAGVPSVRSRGSASPEPRTQPAVRRRRRPSSARLVPIRGGLVPEPGSREAS